MQGKQKIITTILWAVLVVAMVSVVATGVLSRRRSQLDVLFNVPAFSLTDQENKTITRESMLGKPWIASFVFSQCPGVCPGMTRTLSKLQNTIDSNKVEIVSFTVDPEHDTPEVLKAYAAGLNAQPGRWHFLTGPKDTMFDLSHGMMLGAAPANGTEPITHSDRFLLVDSRGQVRGFYDSKDQESLKKLASDAEQLAGE